MTTTRFALDTDKARAALAMLAALPEDAALPEGSTFELENLADWMDLTTFNPVWHSTDSSDLHHLLAGAWADGWITGPSEPFIASDEDSYCYSTKIGEDAGIGQGFYVQTEWHEIRNIVNRGEDGDPLTGHAAVLDLLADMVSDLNSVLHRFDAHVARQLPADEVRALAVEVAGWEDGFCNVETADDLAVKVLAMFGETVEPRQREDDYEPEVAERLQRAMAG